MVKSFHRPRCSLIPAIGALFVMVGCNSGLESSVSGEVTLDARPIGPGTVNFVPAGRQRNPAVGTIAPDGSYTLKTSNTVGLPAGTYQVAVSVRDLSGNAGPGQPPSEVTYLHPQRYASVETSGLEYTVEPGRNRIDIELRSDE